MRLFKTFFLTLLVVGLLQSCTQQGACEGEIIIENPLSDTTIQLEEGEHTIDLSSPPVFVHTVNKSLALSATVYREDVNIAGAGIQQDTTSGDFDLLVIEPLETGKAKIIVESSDGCLEGAINEFTVTVE